MLCLITNRKIARAGTLPEVVELAVRGGVATVMLREKDLPDRELLALAKRLREITEAAGAKMIVNSRLSTAIAVSADGYHCSYQAFQRRPDFPGRVGVSVHSLQEAVNAANRGADYLLAGHIYQTASKQGLPPKGTSLIKDISTRTALPVVALGGIVPEKVREVLAAGASGIAVMSYIMADTDPRAAAARLAAQLPQEHGDGS